MGTLVAESEKAPKIEPCLTTTTSTNSFDQVVENPNTIESEVCLMNQVVVVENAETPKIEPCLTTTNQVVENPKTPESEVLLYLTNQVVMENAETPLESEICLITNQMIVENANTPPPDTGICLTNKAFSEDNCESSSSPVKITTELLVTPSSSSSVVVHPPPPPPSSGALVPVSTGDDKVKKALYKFGQRTSNFRGVTRHRWTGKFEAHLWDNTSISETRKRKGKQVYLGGYETEEKAAVAYDLAALKFWGAAAHSKLNFPISKYEKEIEEMIDMSKEEYINSLRRQSICFARGNSNYRGVTRQHEGRRWQARIGRVAGGRDIYLGTYDTEEEAAEAYDIAAVKLRGMGAITNFHISNYYKEGSKELDILPISAEEERPPVRIRRFKITTA